MTAAAYFSADYFEARDKFRDAAAGAGARLQAHVNPLAQGPGGEPLSTDTAWLGPPQASRVLVTVSGTHGAEGFAGAGAQVGTFLGGAVAALPTDTALFAIHAINPYGFAWLRRVTEGNVDLNRNFVAHDRPLPRNAGYDELADAICPAEWSAAALAEAQARLDAYRDSHGIAALSAAITGGQYAHADGIFYGGADASWSRHLVAAFVARELAHARRVAVIDYHTGLGPYGHGERIVIHPGGSAGMERARDWYGPDITSPMLGTSRSADVMGDMLTGLERALPQAQVTGMALEFGVRPWQETLDAIRADNWLHLHGSIASKQGRDIKAVMRDSFYGDAADWKDMVFEQAMDAQRRALHGLTG